MLNWQTLYNKYRPKNFSDVVGQKNVIKVLENSLRKNYLHHGIIFTGIRGVGKTSLSRIFAIAMNCLNKEASHIPCGECENCNICANSNVEDIIEIDGATHTGVDSMRLIIEDTMFMPKLLPYKVFIIDEVHMLSKSAFNSILKLLENPPKRVKFIFCTTEKHKIPDTVISRCLLLELTKVSLEDIHHRLKYITKKEHITIDEEALRLIGVHSQGSLRDALSILENLYLLVPNQIITATVIQEHLRLLSEENILNIYSACLEGNWPQAIKDWQVYYDKGYSSLEFLKRLSVLLCNLLQQKLNPTLHQETFDHILNNFDVSNSIIIGHWQICLYAIKHIYNGEELLVDMVLIMITIMEDNISFEELQKTFPGIRLI